VPTARSPGARLAAKRRKVTHYCPVCGIEFVGIKTAVYCSNRCRQAAKIDRKAPKP
jgi:predicted RNA-binding Zn-ribbon protein involved in translation (DUF1610 family)